MLAAIPTMSQPRPLLHIGYHKTATTWFQKNLYPQAAGCAYQPRPLVRDLFMNTTAWSFDPEQVRARLQTDKRLILSEEDFCGYTENGGLLEALSRDMARRLHATYPDADVVIFIRNQLDMIRSSYLQYVRTGGTHSLHRFLHPSPVGSVFRHRWYKKPLLMLDHFSYQHLIGHYQHLFGHARVHVFCYEDFAADNQAFVREYARRLQLDVNLDSLNYSVHNEALGLFTLFLSRLLGPFTRWGTTNRLQLLPILPRWIPKAGLKALNKTPFSGPQVSNERLFGKKLMLELQQLYAKDNLALLHDCKLDLPLRQYHYPLTDA
jgi:hypothetical protein